MSVLKENEYFKDLFAYCRKTGLIPKEAQKLLLVDCDTLRGALVTISGELSFVVEKVIEKGKEFSLINELSKETGTNCSPEMIQQLIDSKNTLARYIQDKGRNDKAITIEKTDVLCSRICAICEECANEIKDIVSEAYDDDEVWVVAIGTNFALYPVEHAIRTAIAPIMPFLPITNFICDRLCVVDVNEARSQGRAYIEENDITNTPLPHNVTLQLIQGDINGEKASVAVLANRGTKYSELANSEYTQPIFTLATEPITLFADTEPYKLNLPHSAFKHGESADIFRFALRLQNDVPILEVRSENGAVTNITLDKQIYTEE